MHIEAPHASPIDYTLVAAEATAHEADLLVLFITSEALEASDAQALCGVSKEKVAETLYALAKAEGFKGKPGQTFSAAGISGFKARRVLLVGAGEQAKRDEGALRRAAGIAGRQAVAKRATRVAIGLAPGADDAQALAQIVEGFDHGAYTFTRYKSVDEARFEGVREVALLSADGAGLSDALMRSLQLAHGVTLARDLVNEPPSHLTPDELANQARHLGARYGLKCTILDHQALQSRGFNLIMAVGKGSAHPPRLIHLTYTPEGEVKHRLALVGKGITFDTGGYSLKPSASQVAMHCDMAGAAAVLGAAEAIGALKPAGVEVHFIVPTAENMVSGSAMLVQDVYKGYGGQTVEVLNTDAEGRLILADALAYAQEYSPDTIIDLATLTGACVVALGDHTTGLFTDDEGLYGQLTDAAAVSHEDLWRLPLHAKLDAQLDSHVADMKNIGGRTGGAITAALFLKRWVKLDRWAHLDIAGPAYTEQPSEGASAGGTGVGVATLVALASALAEG